MSRSIVAQDSILVSAKEALGWPTEKVGLRLDLIVGDGDVVILKSISPPALDEFDPLIEEAEKQARQVEAVEKEGAVCPTTKENP